MGVVAPGEEEEMYGKHINIKSYIIGEKGKQSVTLAH